MSTRFNPYQRILSNEQLGPTRGDSFPSDPTPANVEMPRMQHTWVTDLDDGAAAHSIRQNNVVCIERNIDSLLTVRKRQRMLTINAVIDRCRQYAGKNVTSALTATVNVAGGWTVPSMSAKWKALQDQTDTSKRYEMIHHDAQMCAFVYRVAGMVMGANSFTTDDTGANQQMTTVVWGPSQLDGRWLLKNSEFQPYFEDKTRVQNAVWMYLLFQQDTPTAGVRASVLFDRKSYLHETSTHLRQYVRIGEITYVPETRNSQNPHMFCGVIQFHPQQQKILF